MIEADHLGRLRTGAASGVAARHLARAGARTLGVIGCGSQAETQVACIRAAVPTHRAGRRVLPNAGAAGGVLRRGRRGARREPSRAAAGQDVVVTITSSRDPVLRGEWLAPGALVVAAGANVVNRRELDNGVLERARFVCCDWLERREARVGRSRRAGAGRRARLARGARAPRGRVGGGAGRQSDDDIVVFKSNGLAAWDVALGAEALRLARERGVGTRALGAGSEAFAASSMSPEIASMISGRSSSRICCSGERRFCTYLSSRISFERPAALVLADDVPRDVLFGGASLEEEREGVLEHCHETRLYPGDMRRSSREGRYAERVLVGVDDVGEEERIVLWIERRPGAVWAVGRAVNPQLRESDEPRPGGRDLRGVRARGRARARERGARGRRAACSRGTAARPTRGRSRGRRSCRSSSAGSSTGSGGTRC